MTFTRQEDDFYKKKTFRGGPEERRGITDFDEDVGAVGYGLRAVCRSLIAIS
jgi:hypothetical protein